MHAAAPFKDLADQEQFSREVDELFERWFERFEKPDQDKAIEHGLNPNDPMVLEGWTLVVSWSNIEQWMLPYYIKRDRQSLFFTRGQVEVLADWATGLTQVEGDYD